MQHTPAEAATEVGADQDRPNSSATAGILIGATLGLTAWALIALALLAAYLP